jgi:hypothetical protein
MKTKKIVIRPLPVARPTGHCLRRAAMPCC